MKILANNHILEVENNEINSISGYFLDQNWKLQKVITKEYLYKQYYEGVFKGFVTMPVNSDLNKLNSFFNEINSK